MSIDTTTGVGPPHTMYVSSRGRVGSNTATSLPFDSGYYQGNDDDGSATAPQVASGRATVATSTQRSKFVRNNDIKDDDITDTNVVKPKTKHVIEGTKDYNSIMKDATAALSTKFGVAKHMIVTADDLEALLGNQIKSLCIQHSILQLILCSPEGHQHCKHYGFMSILFIPNFKAPNLNQTQSSDPSDWWDELETNLWEDWDKITKRQATSWQYFINKHFSDKDRASSFGLYVFLVNSSSAELNKETKNTFNKLHKNRKG